MSPLFLLVFVGLTVAQPHHGPDGDGPTCYACGPARGKRAPGDHFPACLQHSVTCHSDQVCRIKYGGHEPHIECHAKAACEREVNDAGRQCSTGGAMVRDGCQICCTDETCLTDSVRLIDANAVANINPVHVHCPKECTPDNIATCASQGHVCSSEEFCKVKVDEDGRMHGACEDIEDLHHCNDEVADHHCDRHGHNCVQACCTDDQCVAGSLGSNQTSLFEFLKGDCEDQLPSDQCTQMDVSKHLCADRLALRLCPQTCGLCSVFHADLCKDTVINNGCPALVASEDICNHFMGTYACPVTCNKCDELLDEAVKQALQNAAQNGSAPTSAPTASSLSCSAMMGLPCSDLANLCSQVECPPACGPCLATAPAATATIPPDSSSVGLPDVSTMAPLPSVPDSSALPALDSSIAMSTFGPLVSDTMPGFMDSSPPVPLDSSPASHLMPGFMDSSPPIPVDSSPASHPMPFSMDSSPPVPLDSSPASHPMPVSMDSYPPVPLGSSPAGPMDISTDTNPPIVSSPMSPAARSTGTCEDTIQQLSCADVEDVCSSPLLVSYCQKFCNLC